MPRLRAESKKRAARRDERNEVRQAVYSRQNGRCVAYAASPCSTPDMAMSDVHEVVSRARGGDPFAYDPNITIGLCRKHHSWFTDNPYQAEARGFLLPSWATATMLIEARFTRAAYAGAMPDSPPEWWLTKPERMEWWKSNQD